MNSNRDKKKKPPPPPARPQRGDHSPTVAGAGATPPCGACKFLRRKCVEGCVFAPYFGTEQGAARFAAVHKVFGASNVSKLLMHVPTARRHEAVITVCYEAQARLADPVYGCVATILALQHQIASLQSELATVQSQLIRSRLAVATALQGSQAQHIGVLQPAYSNSSATINSMVNLGSFQLSSFDLDDGELASGGFEPLQPSLEEEEEEAEGDSHHSVVFTNGLFHPR